MATWRQIAVDVARTLGQNVDDLTIFHNQIIYWGQHIAAKLLEQHIQKSWAYGATRRDSKDHLSVFLLTVAQDASLENRHYFDLPGKILDLDLDRGIDYIAYWRGETAEGCKPGRRFTRTTPRNIELISGSEMQKPSERNPYYSRANQMIDTPTHMDRVYLIGPQQITRVEAGFMLSMPAYGSIDPDAEVQLPEGLLYPLRMRLLDCGRWMMMVPQERLKNDGRFDDGQQTTAPKLISVSDQLIQTDNTQ